MLLCLSACSFIGVTQKDYNADIREVASESIDDELMHIEAGETYYTSPGFALCVSMNGYFKILDYFSLSGNVRNYRNLYLYQYDYFYMVTDDLRDLYASVGDNNDLQYVEEEKVQGKDVQINVKKAGIYDISFDVKTLKFDL